MADATEIASEEKTRQVLWFVESRQKINTLQVTCGIPGSEDQGESSEKDNETVSVLDIFPDRFALKSEPNSSAKAGVFRLTGDRVLPSSCQGLSMQSGNEIHLRLSTTKQESSRSLYTHNFVPEEEMKLLKSSSCQFQCRLCGASLLRSDVVFGRVLEMPSENWQELVDTWLCHCSHQLPDSLTQPLTPNLDDCLVSRLYMLLNHSSFELNSLVLENNDEESLVRCFRCRQLLGHTPQGADRDCKTLLEKSIHLYKYSVHLLVNGQRDLSWSRGYTMETFISGKILTESQAHMNYQFIIEAAEQSTGRKTYCLLWVLNTDSSITSNIPDTGGQAAKDLLEGHTYKPDEDEEACGSSHKILKILYKIVKEKDSESTLSVWEQMMAAEPLLLHHETCLHLLLLLTASTQTLPPSSRVMNDFKVGFLKL